MQENNNINFNNINRLIHLTPRLSFTLNRNITSFHCEIKFQKRYQKLKVKCCNKPLKIHLNVLCPKQTTCSTFLRT